MDLVFLLFTTVLIILTIVIYLINEKFKKKSTLIEKFNKMKRDDPTIISFCLEYNESTKLYTNVFLSGKEKFVTKTEPNPVDLHGNYIRSFEHGDLKLLQDGYEIEGFTNKFKCPKGFIGSNCEITPICSNADVDKYKPLYKQQFKTIHPDLNLSDDFDGMHPKIKIQCLTNGEFKLVECKQNELLDIDLNCKVYDICVDHIDGFKHNYPKDEIELLDTQYFTCKEHKSVLNTCPENTSFSNFNQTCVPKSKCLNKDDAQIQIDDNSYIQCKNDSEKIIFCENGIIDNNGQLQCKTECEPRLYSYADHVLQYTYGSKTCDSNNKPIEIMCNHENAPKTIDLEWGEPFKFKFDHWPKEVLSNDAKTCTTDVENNQFSFIENPRVSFKWSDFMQQAHNFNPKTLKFYCDSKYSWNYMTNKIEPNDFDSNLYFVDSSQPCQDNKKNKAENPWFLMEYITFPENKIPMVYGVLNFLEQKCNWPVYIKKTNQYMGCTFSYDLKNRFIVQTTYLSEIPPYGFERVDEKNTDIITNLSLIGYKSFNSEFHTILQNYSWWFANTENISPLNFTNYKSVEIKYPLPQKIKTEAIDKSLTFCIIWSFITKPIIIVQNEFEIHSTGIHLNNHIYPPCLYSIILQKHDNPKLIKVIIQDGSFDVPHFEITLP